MMKYKKGDRVTFSKERLERAQHRTLQSSRGQATSPDGFVMSHFGEVFTVKRSFNIGDNRYVLLEEHYNNWYADSLRMEIRDEFELDEELFEI